MRKTLGLAHCSSEVERLHCPLNQVWKNMTPMPQLVAHHDLRKAKKAWQLEDKQTQSLSLMLAFVPGLHRVVRIFFEWPFSILRYSHIPCADLFYFLLLVSFWSSILAINVQSFQFSDLRQRKITSENRIFLLRAPRPQGPALPVYCEYFEGPCSRVANSVDFC